MKIHYELLSEDILQAKKYELQKMLWECVNYIQGIDEIQRECYESIQDFEEQIEQGIWDPEKAQKNIELHKYQLAQNEKNLLRQEKNAKSFQKRIKAINDVLEKKSDFVANRKWLKWKSQK